MPTLKALCRNVHCESVYGKASLPYNKMDDWQKNAHNYRVTLKYQRRAYTFDFFMGSANTDEPSSEGTLECLLSDASSADQDFESFCSDMGYDSDSRKAERIYQACQKVRGNLQRLLGEDFEAFLYADR